MLSGQNLRSCSQASRIPEEAIIAVNNNMGEDNSIVLLPLLLLLAAG